MIPPAEDMPSAKSESRFHDDSYELREMRILRKNVEFTIGSLDAFRMQQAYGPEGELLTEDEKNAKIDPDHEDMRTALRRMLTELNRWHGADKRGW